MDSADTVIDVNRQLSEMLKQEIAKVGSSKHFTIFRVPECARRGKEELFEPSVVSIGPFHRGKAKLRPMEEHKMRCLRDYLDRKPDLSIESLVMKMRELEERARRCYCETVDLSSDDFVMMLLLDGCLLNEFFFKTASWSTMMWSKHSMQYDMLMMENQIPFFILEELWRVIGVPASEKNLRVLVSIMTNGIWEVDSQRVRPDVINHLLHLCYHYIVPNSQQIAHDQRSGPSFGSNFISALCKPYMRIFHSQTNELSYPTDWCSIPCATKLCDAGINIKIKTKPQHKLNITFNQSNLEIPMTHFEDGMKLVLANILAYEQFDEDSPQYFTSFLAFMWKIVASTNDVLILEQSGVMKNFLCSNDELVEFVNEIGKNTWLNEDHYLAEMFKSINRHCRSSWHRNRAKLKRDYFSNPWSVISFVAGIILLILTFIQAFYAVYSYHVPKQ